MAGTSYIVTTTVNGVTRNYPTNNPNFVPKEYSAAVQAQKTTTTQSSSSSVTGNDIISGGIGRTSGIRPPVTPTLMSANNYTIKGISVSPGVAVKLAANTEPIYKTSSGILTTNAKEAIPAGTITEAHNIPQGPINKGISQVKDVIGTKAAYASELVKSTDVTWGQPLEPMALESTKRAVIAKTMAFNLENSKPTGNIIKDFNTGFNVAALKTSSFLNTQMAGIYKEPATLATTASLSYLGGLGLGAAFSGAEGALAIEAESMGPKTRLLAGLGMGAVKGGLAGKFISGIYIAGKNELQTKGTIIHTATAAGFGILGAEAGSNMFKIRTKYTNLEPTSSSSKLKILTNEGQASASNELIRTKDIIGRNELQFEGNTLFKSSKYDIISTKARVGGVFNAIKGNEITSERIIDVTQTKSSFIEKKGVGKLVGKPLIDKSFISVTDVMKRTSSPLEIDLKTGTVNPARTNTPTTFSAFEARSSTGDITTGLQKTYLSKFSTPKIIDLFENKITPASKGFEVDSRTVIFGSKGKAPGYELSTKTSKADLFDLTGAKPKVSKLSLIEDITAKEGIARNMGKSGTLFQTKGTYRKILTTTESHQPTKTLKMAPGLEATITGKKTTYKVDLFKGNFLTTKKGTASAESVSNSFKDIMPPLININKGISTLKKGSNKPLILGTKSTPAKTTKNELGISSGGNKLVMEPKAETVGKLASAHAIVETVTMPKEKIANMGLYLKPILNTQKATSTRLKISTIPRTKLGMQQYQLSTQAQATQSQYQLRSQLKIGLVTKQGLTMKQIFNPVYQPTNPTVPDIPVVPIIPLGASMPNLYLGQQLFGGKGKKVKFEKKYYSSLTATVFNIRGPKPSDFAISTGLGVRPILAR